MLTTSELKQINRGGEKISPLEVDAALLSVEGVGEAVAFGVEDEKFGEKVRSSALRSLLSEPVKMDADAGLLVIQVWAAVVLKSNAKLGEKQIIDACRQKISAVSSPPA